MIKIKALLAKIVSWVSDADKKFTAINGILQAKEYSIAAGSTLTLEPGAGTRLLAVTASSNANEKSMAIGSFINGTTQWDVVHTGTNITYGGTGAMTIKNTSGRAAAALIIVFSGSI